MVVHHRCIMLWLLVRPSYELMCDNLFAFFFNSFLWWYIIDSIPGFNKLHHNQTHMASWSACCLWRMCRPFTIWLQCMGPQEIYAMFCYLLLNMSLPPRLLMMTFNLAICLMYFPTNGHRQRARGMWSHKLPFHFHHSRFTYVDIFMNVIGFSCRQSASQ